MLLSNGFRSNFIRSSIIRSRACAKFSKERGRKEGRKGFRNLEWANSRARTRVYLFSDLRECDAPRWVSLFRTSGILDENNCSPREDHNASTSFVPANDVPRALDLWCWGFKGRVNFSPRFTRTPGRKSRPSRKRFEKNPLPQILSVHYCTDS